VGEGKLVIVQGHRWRVTGGVRGTHGIPRGHLRLAQAKGMMKNDLLDNI
jgi:hypothetical protein